MFRIFRSKLLLVLSLASFVMIGVGADLGWFDRQALFYQQIPLGDSWVHFFLLGALSFIGTQALPKPLGWYPKVSLFSVLLLVAISIEEVTQLVRANRSFSFYDLMANMFGVLIFGRLAVILVRSYSKPSSPMSGTNLN